MAEQLSGTVFSFNLTVETPIDIDEMIYTLSPTDLPLIHGVNSDGMPILPSRPCSDTTVYWQEDEVLLPYGNTAEALDGSETVIDMATGHAARFAVGDGIRIDDEVMIVTGCDIANNQLTVTRGSASETNTTAATHLTGAEVHGLGSILIEGGVGTTNFSGRDKYSNTCQIFSKKIQMSATEQLIRKYGVPSELARQTKHAMQNAATGIENAAFYGIRHTHASTYRRQMGGIASYVDANVNSTADWLTVEAIEAMLEDIHNLGGSGDGAFICAKPQAFAALTNTTGSERVQTVTIDDARRGRRRAQVVMTEYGEVQLVRNRWIRATDAFLLQRGAVVLRKFRPMQLQKLAKTDDTDSFMVVAEHTLEVKGADHMGRWTGLDTSAPLPADLV